LEERKTFEQINLAKSKVFDIFKSAHEEKLFSKGIQKRQKKPK